MSLRLYHLQDFAYRTEKSAFEQVAATCRTHFATLDETALLIGNYRLQGIAVPFLLITPRFFVLFLVKSSSVVLTSQAETQWEVQETSSPHRSSSSSSIQELLRQQRLFAALGKKHLGGEASTIPLFGCLLHREVHSDTAPATFWEVQPQLFLTTAGEVRPLLTFLEQQSATVPPIDTEAIESLFSLSPYLVSPTGEYVHPQPSTNTYAHTADDFFQTLAYCLHEADMSMDERCSVVYEVLQQAAEAPLRHYHLNFSGLFPKVNHLLLEHHASPTLSRSVHDARSQLRQAGTTTEAALRHAFPYHLKAVCQFIALVYDTAIPPSLLEHLPTSERHRRRTQKLTEVCRVVVESWDKNYIYAQDEATGSLLKVAYGDSNDLALGNDGYLYDLLSPQAQLNLIAPKKNQEEREPIVYPELIIYEPDCLVNVTSISKCFQPYGTLPYAYFLQRFEKFRSSPALALGNLAGTLLDEQLCGEEKPLTEHLSAFFQAQALTVANEELDMEQLRQDAQAQKRHIQQGLQTLAEEEGANWEQCIVEPTFFSERLGLSGRMDLFHLEKGWVVEQKSGKGRYGSNDERVLEQEPHYVQLLLYQALLQYGFSLKNNAIKSHLLYSKYARPVVKIAPAPQLLTEAFRIRNQIVWCNFKFATEGFRFLEQLTPELLNRSRLSNRLWSDYLRPQLHAILSPIQQASPIAKAYFYRWVQFVQQELLCAKVGNGQKERAGFAGSWQTPLTEKLKTGDIYAQVALQLPEGEEAINTLTVFPSAKSKLFPTNFRKGDPVVLYPYQGNEPHVCKELVLRGVIVDMNAEDFSIQLLHRQTSRKVFDFYEQRDFQWAVEHDLLESSFHSLFQGLHAFLSAPLERQEWVLLQKSPRVLPSRPLRGEYGAFNELVARSKAAQDFFLIFGPPGTGKTSHGLLNIVKEELLEESHSVLLLAYTHRAVDEICEKLEKAGIDFIRVGRPNTTEVAPSYLLEERLKDCTTAAEVKSLLHSTQVYCATTATLNASPQLLEAKHFHLAIIDEASQLLEPQLMGILSAMQGEHSAIDRFIFIGDHKQLPAVVRQDAAASLVTDPLLTAMGWTDCRQSLFERLYTRYGDDPRFAYHLTQQGRMHETIAAFPNEFFYEGRLSVVPLPHQQAALSLPHEPVCEDLKKCLSQRVTFLPVTAPPASHNDKVNEEEADLIAAVAATFYQQYLTQNRAFDPQSSLGVIVPYRNQILAVRQAIQRLEMPALAEITIDTVERYQGSQREVILYGLTIRHTYQLNFLTANTFAEKGKWIDRKLNVAMTRAKEHLVMVGNPSVLRQAPLFAQLIDWIERQERKQAGIKKQVPQKT